ncbi:hypothetical protein Pse7367_3263 [Thalassoporum mexicanum PCC 7367]|uniref:hypothetical protein n=1 Tax=Thalassoporum mexicanum TaxID=3457544 RepID=UPI00029F86CE|nr:hypothetical protein [Pseudanabaena sp. PCC 7367]AFY71506.1 hypothetical protein Pse7367_3263 [Pseudanabaena sp. PCC 7367]
MSEEEIELLRLADNKLDQLAMYMTQLAITQERTEKKLEQFIESQKSSFAEVKESFAELRVTTQQQADTTQRLVGIVELLIKQQQ